MSSRAGWGETKIVNGQPRTKGIQNPFVAAARAHKGGAHRDKRDRRSQDARRTREWRDEA